MCTGNVRAPQRDHAARIARFAIDAVHAASEVAIREGDEAMGTVNIRAGEAVKLKCGAQRAGRDCTAWGCSPALSALRGCCCKEGGAAEHKGQYVLTCLHKNLFCIV